MLSQGIFGCQGRLLEVGSKDLQDIVGGAGHWGHLTLKLLLLMELLELIIG